MKLSRRGFVGSSAGGVGLASLPTFLSGCFHSNEQKLLTDEIPVNPFQDWFGIDQQVIQKVLAELTRNGADFADLYFEHTRENVVNYQDGIVNKAHSSIEQGVGLRVVVGEQVGFAFTEDLTLESMIKAARSAAAIAKGRPVDLPRSYKQKRFANHYRIAIPWSEVGIDHKLPMINRLAQHAKSQDPAVQKVSASWVDSESRVLIADLSGNVSADVRPMASIRLITTLEKNGKVQSNTKSMAGRHSISHFSDDKLKKLAADAVRDTLVLFEAEQPPAGELPVILAAGASGILLHEAIGHGLEADFNFKKTSIYSDLMNKKIAEDFVTIVDSGIHPNERGSINCDDEGQPSQETTLVQNGKLVSYLHDQISAKKYGIKSTGSGRRQSFRHPPMPRMRSTYMKDGPHTRDEIIANVKKGIIAETFTNGQVNIGAGDFTFYIKNGWLVENGKVVRPIKDANIIGNGPQALKDITMAANDFRLDYGGWTCGKNGQGVPVSQGLPTVLVSKMNVGGKHA